ncbi:MAG: hypothetical protein KJ892_09835, partial [Gammaproteobacteria bacterium]|nr:hypothetical protein [Gammaproteobacteria bacterium]
MSLNQPNNHPPPPKPPPDIGATGGRPLQSAWQDGMNVAVQWQLPIPGKADESMSIVDEKSIFIAMKQDGPFAVRDQISFEHPFCRQNRQAAKVFRHDRQTTAKYRAVRDQLFDLLQIECFNEIPDLIQNPVLRAQRTERAYRLLGNLFGISGELSEIRSKIHEYMNTADAVIGQIRNKVLAAYNSHIEISNEIETSKNPIDLLLIIFDDRYHKK